MLACLALALLTLAVLPALTACASGATTTADVDKALLGIWTTEEKLGRVVLNERGEPPESVPVGQWMSFTASGRWYHVSRYITIAIGGIGVEEGTVTARQGQIKVAGRTESFFPDAGSPQHATYRTAAPDLALLYRVATEGGEKVLYVKGNTESHETRYRRIPD